MKDSLNNVLITLRNTFTKPGGIIVTLLTALFMLLLTIFISIRDLVGWVIKSDAISSQDKAKILWSSLGVFRTNFTLTSQIITVIVALLAGINVALLVYYLKRRVSLQKESGASLFGIILGMLGVGCSACGSIILSSLLGVATATSFLSVLPLRGAEFGIGSIVLILGSIYYTAKKASDPEGCRVVIKKNNGEN